MLVLIVLSKLFEIKLKQSLTVWQLGSIIRALLEREGLNAKQ